MILSSINSENSLRNRAVGTAIKHGSYVPAVDLNKTDSAPRFNGILRVFGGGLIGSAGSIIAAIAFKIALISGLVTVIHKGMVKRVGGDEVTATKYIKEGCRELSSLDKDNIKGLVPFFNKLNQAIDAYNRNTLSNLPPFNSLSQDGQAKTIQILNDVQKMDWKANNALMILKFNNWVDDVLVKEGLLKPDESQIIKYEAREVLKNSSSYENFHQFGVKVFKGSLYGLGGGAAAIFLGLMLAVSGLIRRD